MALPAARLASGVLLLRTASHAPRGGAGGRARPWLSGALQERAELKRVGGWCACGLATAPGARP